MKHAHIIETKLEGWYDDKIHKEIPNPNIKVDEEIWKEAISINANCYEDGKFIVKDFRTEEEVVKEELINKIVEAKIYLQLTDYKMTVDYFATLSKDIQDELILKRSEAREFIRASS